MHVTPVSAHRITSASHFDSFWGDREPVLMMPYPTCTPCMSMLMQGLVQAQRYHFVNLLTVCLCKMKGASQRMLQPQE